MRKVLWSILLIATVVVGTTVLFGAGRQSSPRPSTYRPAAPLPPATAAAGGTDPVRRVPGRPTRIRVEVYGTTPTADLSFEVRSTGDDSSPTELPDHALPWAAELDAPEGEKNLSVTGSVYDPDATHQLLCRIIVGGVVVVTEQQADYLSCSLDLGDLGG